MADNTTLNPGTGGDVIATDDVSGVKYQRVKICYGADGSATDASSGSPLPVTLDVSSLATAANQSTANSSLSTIATNTGNGATAANQATANTSLSSIATNTGNIPAKGQATMSNSTPVTLASDQSTITVGSAVVTVATEFTRPADTTAYTAGDVVSNSTSSTTLISLANVARANGGSIYVTGLRLVTDKKSITPRFRVHFFNASNPTVSADNAANKIVYVDVSKYLGYWDLPAMQTGVDTTNSDCSWASDYLCRIPMVLGGATTTLYAMLETLDAFTPASGQKFTLSVIVDRN